MFTARIWRGALAALALSTTLTSTGCAPTITGARPDVTARALPRVDDVIRAPAKRPAPSRNEDARLFARRALDYGDANSAALTDGREAYEGLRRGLAGGQP